MTPGEGLKYSAKEEHQPVRLEVGHLLRDYFRVSRGQSAYKPLQGAWSPMYTSESSARQQPERRCTLRSAHAFG